MASRLVSQLDFAMRRQLALKGIVKLDGQLIESYPEKPKTVRIFISSTFTGQYYIAVCVCHICVSMIPMLLQTLLLNAMN